MPVEELGFKSSPVLLPSLTALLSLCPRSLPLPPHFFPLFSLCPLSFPSPPTLLSSLNIVYLSLSDR